MTATIRERYRSNTRSETLTYIYDSPHCARCLRTPESTIRQYDLRQCGSVRLARGKGHCHR